MYSSKDVHMSVAVQSQPIWLQSRVNGDRGWPEEGFEGGGVSFIFFIKAPQTPRFSPVVTSPTPPPQKILSLFPKP